MIESNFKRALERKIDLYVNGKLNEEQVDELWAELIQDEYYLEYTKSVANLKAVIERQRSAKKQAPVFRLREYANYGVAAAIAIIIGVVGVLNYSGTGTGLDISPQPTLTLDNIRGANDAVAQNDNEIIKEAIRLATDGEIEAAIILLQNELDGEESPELIAELSLTLGSIQYNYGDYNASLVSFQRVISQNEVDDLTLEKGYWFLGNTYFQLDRLREAQEAFQKVYDFDKQYSRIAKSYIDALSSVE